jgi:hypothetical protein
LAYFFSPEERGDMFLRNIVDFQRTKWRNIPEDRTLDENRSRQDGNEIEYETPAFALMLIFITVMLL